MMILKDLFLYSKNAKIFFVFSFLLGWVSGLSSSASENLNVEKFNSSSLAKVAETDSKNNPFLDDGLEYPGSYEYEDDIFGPRASTSVKLSSSKVSFKKV